MLNIDIKNKKGLRSSPQPTLEELFDISYKLSPTYIS